MNSDLLFYRSGNLSEFLSSHKEHIKREINSQDSSYILNVDEQDFCNHLLEKYQIESPIIIEKNIYQEEPVETNIDVSSDYSRDIDDRSKPFFIRGIAITIILPFTGDGSLFHYKPSTFTLSPPRGQVDREKIKLIYKTPEHAADKIKQQYSNDLQEINNYLSWLKKDIAVFSTSLKSFIQQLITNRKQLLLKDSKLISDIGVPLKSRNNVPDTYSIPSIKKKLSILKPTATTKITNLDPTLSASDYEQILRIVHNMTLVMERSPNTFSKLKEEEIRDHFLIHLNGHYEGQATGETFNYQGKTDILIRHNNKNIFIAECKIWGGSKILNKTIDQLLNYTSWRDTKTAIFLFSRNKDFTSILQQMIM